MALQPEVLAADSEERVTERLVRSQETLPPGSVQLLLLADLLAPRREMLPELL